MEKAKILVVDDEPDIRDILRITLTEGGYDVLEAKNGHEALKIVQAHVLNLVILDYKIPGPDGVEVCHRIKNDILIQHLPIIMLTGKGEILDKVKGLDAGADDYMVKPFEPQELLARIRTMLRRSQRDLDANPLTRLPGNVSILNELRDTLDKKQPFAVCYIDLDKFKSYNDTYGFERGDRIIQETARMIIKIVKMLGNPEDFIGHIGGDDFVIITSPQKVDAICKKLIAGFDKKVPTFYNREDQKRGYITAQDRRGRQEKIFLLSVSIGVVTNEHRSISHVAEIGEIGADVKAHAKQSKGSNYVKDKRK